MTVIHLPVLLFTANRSISSPGWTYARASGSSPQQQQTQQTSFNQSGLSWQSFQNNSLNSTPAGAPGGGNKSGNNSGLFVSPYQKYAKGEIITDARDWQQYLKETGGTQNESKNLFNVDTVDNGSPADRQAINSFWNYCNTAANVLKNSIYQMAPTTTATGPSPMGSAVVTNDELGLFGNADIDGHSDEIKKICSMGHLTQYVYNIRSWIACTVLHRLETEITKTNHAFEVRGLSDIKIGSVGLDRLKKTADNQQMIAMYAPMLPMLVPFLDMSTNQEYLVQRIRDLAKGSVLAEYRWNSGGSYNGLKWDEHLPTDSAVCCGWLFLWIRLYKNCLTKTFILSRVDNLPFVLCVFGQSIGAVAATGWTPVLQSIRCDARQKVNERHIGRDQE